MNQDTLRLPPQNLAAERSVLGCMLLEHNAIDDVADVLQPDHFYSDVHGIVYRAILKLHESGIHPDAVTVAEELQARKQLEDVGGLMLLHELMDAVPHSAHAKYYADIVRDKWLQRSLTNVCTDVLKECYDGTGDTPDVLDKAERGIFNLLEGLDCRKKTDMQSMMLGCLDRFNERLGNSGVISGLSTGFADLDNQTNGFHPAELVILAARPSMGKTAFVCNIAEWCISSVGITTLIFSLEQSQLDLAERLICLRGRLDGHRVRKGLLEPSERDALLAAASELSPLPLYIDDEGGRTVGQISAICRRTKRQHGLGLVIVDYLQLIEPEDKRVPREQQISTITRRLKRLAKDLDVPVIALSQLNRGVETREDKRPRLADLRESGAIEQDADIVMFLHRPDAYNPDDQPGLAEVIVAKHRSGPTGIVNLHWQKESMRFVEADTASTF